MIDMTETNFRYSLNILLSELADAQIIIESKIEQCRSFADLFGIPFERLFQNEFDKLWVERSDCNVCFEKQFATNENLFCAS